LGVLKKLRRGSLFLIRSYRFYDENMNESGQAIGEATAHSSEKVAVIE
jgi:hypothetical protein